MRALTPLVAEDCRVDSQLRLHRFLLFTRRSGCTTHEVGGATSQFDLPSLTTLSVAFCGRLQLEFSHWATSVAQNKILDDNPHLKQTIYYRYIDDIFVVTQGMTQLQDLKTVIQNNCVLTFLHEIGQNSNIKPALATLSQNLHKINELWYLF